MKEPDRVPEIDADPEVPVFHIRAESRWRFFNFAEMWQHRELLFFLSWRDLKVRYKQTLLGFAWAIITPLLLTVVFTIFFGRLGNLPTDGLPKPVFYMAGLVIWRYFATALQSISNSLVGNAHLLTKVYFPRLLIPLSLAVTALVELVIAFVLLVILMLYFNTAPGMATLFLPALLLMTILTALGIGLFFAALNVRFRDVRSLMPLIVQMWMYITVIIPFSRIPERYGDWRYLYGLNPMAGVVESWRWCLMHHADGVSMANPWPLLAVGAPVTLLLLFVGLAYFHRVERQFADIV